MEFVYIGPVCVVYVYVFPGDCMTLALRQLGWSKDVEGSTGGSVATGKDSSKVKSQTG